MNEKWREVLGHVREISKENCEIFDDIAVYHYFRRFETDLPFNFERHIKNVKESKNLNYVNRSDILKDIFIELSLDTKEKIVNYFLYKFHRHGVSKKKLMILEDFLDKNREELFDKSITP